MKILRRILFFVLLAIALLIGISYLLPSKITLSADFTYKFPKQTVFNEIAELQSWENWSPWKVVKNNSEKQNSVSEIFLTQDSSKKSKDNSKLTLLNCYNSDSIYFLMDFKENGSGAFKFYFHEKDDKTLVKWTFETNINYNPISRWFGLLSKKMLLPDMEKGLLNLNQYLENEQTSISYSINTTTFYPQNFLSIRDTSYPVHFSEQVADNFKRLYRFCKIRRVKLEDEQPLIFFHKLDTNMIVYSAVVNVKDSISRLPKWITFFRSDTTEVVQTQHNGQYRYTVNAYNDLYKYLKINDIKTTGLIIEQYPKNEIPIADSSNSMINILLPIQKPDEQ